MAPPKGITELVRLVGELKSQASAQASYWQETADFCLLRKAWVTMPKTAGQRLNFHKLFDSEAMNDLQTMASGFSSNLTNPATKWFMLATRDRALMKSKDVKVWFKIAEDEIFSTLASTNFDTSIQEFFVDSGCFGTGGIFTEEDPIKRVMFGNLPLATLLIVEDSKGRVVEVYRVYDLTAGQAWGEWGKAAGQKVLDLINKNKFEEKVTIIHATFPREKRIAGKFDSLNMPFASIWLEKSQEHVIKESGFMEFPFAIGRFYKLAGEPWGFSPAMLALADVKMLMVQKKTILRAAQKIVDPPAVLPSKGFLLPFNLNPSGMNYRQPGTSADDYKAIETRANIPIGREMINDTKKDIQRAFFVPLFQAFQDITKQMTVPEVQRRINENMVLLGPVVGRFQQEVLGPIIERVFSILLRQGILPAPPAAIRGQELDIVYVSQLARAQRQDEIVSLENSLVLARAVGELKPGIFDKINEDKIADFIWEINGTNPELLRDDEEVGEIRAQRAEAQEQAAQLEQLQQAATIAKDASQAEKVVAEV